MLLETTINANRLWPAWAEMWALAIGIYAALKLATWLQAQGYRSPMGRSAAYLLAWPGMDAGVFLARPAKAVSSPSLGQWLAAAGKTLCGLALLAIALSPLLTELPWWRAWIGMAGVVFTLHFGLFHFLSCLWRSLGMRATPLMNWPIASTSLSEFWGRRWNLAFRDITHRFVFRPLTAKVGPAAALWVGFLLSGIVHDVVISIPARGGHGLPTLFFLIQAAGIMVERSSAGRFLRLGKGINGWLFTAAMLMLPAPLLFHSPFVDRVVLPFFDAIRSLVFWTTI